MAPRPPEVVASAEAATIATVGHLPLSHAARGAAAIANIGTLAKRSKSLLAGKRVVAEQWAAALPNATWTAPTSGLFGLLTIPGAGDLLPRIEAWATDHGVLVGAGTFFGAPESFRLSWATLPKDRFEESLDKLAKLLR
jgi:DNA-binding transcriptional MocR family regulator